LGVGADELADRRTTRPAGACAAAGRELKIE
jgi:hypothetical protein